MQIIPTSPSTNLPELLTLAAELLKRSGKSPIHRIVPKTVNGVPFVIDIRITESGLQQAKILDVYPELNIVSASAATNTVAWSGGIGPFTVATTCLSVGSCTFTNVDVDIYNVSKIASEFTVYKITDTDGWCAQDDAGEQFEVGVLIVDTGVTPTRQIFAPFTPSLTYAADGVTKNGLCAIYDHFGPDANCDFPIVFTNKTASAITWSGGISPFTVSEYRMLTPNNPATITPGALCMDYEGEVYGDAGYDGCFCGETNVDLTYPVGTNTTTSREASVHKFSGYESAPWCASCHAGLISSGIRVKDSLNTSVYLPYSDMISGPPICSEPIVITVDTVQDSISWTGGTAPFYVQMESDTITNTTLSYDLLTTTQLSTALSSNTVRTAHIYPTNELLPWCYTGVTIKGAIRVTDSSVPAQSKRAFFDTYGGDPLWAFGPDIECLYPLALDTIVGATFTWTGGKAPYLVQVSKSDPGLVGNFVFNNTTVTPGVTSGLTATIGRLDGSTKQYCAHDANNLQLDVGIMVTDAKGSQLFIPYDYFVSGGAFPSYAPTIICAPTITWDMTPITVPYGTTTVPVQYKNATANVAGTFDYSPINLMVTYPVPGTYTYRAMFYAEDQSHYLWLYIKDRTLIIEKQTVTLTLSNLTQTYDGSPKAVTNDSPYAVTTTYNGSATPPTNVGSYAVVCTINDTNYQGSASGTLTINKASQELGIVGISWSGGGGYVYPGLTGTAYTTLNPGGTAPKTYVSSNTSVATVSGTTVTIIAEGTFTLYADKAGDSNYLAAPQRSTTTTATKLSQTLGTIKLTFIGYTGIPSPIRVGMSGTLSITSQGASGNPVVFTSSTPSACTVVGTNFTITGAGYFTISANQAGNTAYAAAAQVTTIWYQSLATQITPTITWNNPMFWEAGTAVNWTNATASAPGVPNVPGTFTYTPAGSSGLVAGTNTLKVDFVPTDTTAYATPAQVTVQNIAKPRLVGGNTISLSTSSWTSQFGPYGTYKVNAASVLSFAVRSVTQGSCAVLATEPPFIFTPPDVATSGSSTITYYCTEAGVASYDVSTTITWGAQPALTIWDAGGGYVGYTGGMGPYTVSLFGSTYCVRLYNSGTNSEGLTLTGVTASSVRLIPTSYQSPACTTASWYATPGSGIQVTDRWGRPASILFTGANLTVPYSQPKSWVKVLWCNSNPPYADRWILNGCIVAQNGYTNLVSYDGLWSIDWCYVANGAWCSFADYGLSRSQFPIPCTSLQDYYIHIINVYHWQ